MRLDIDFYHLPDGTCPVEDFLLALTKDNPKLGAKTFRVIQLLKECGIDLREPDSKPLGDGIFELRAKQSSNISRTLYFFFDGHKAILTNGFVKKGDKTPKNEIERAKRYRNDYLNRKGA